MRTVRLDGVSKVYKRAIAGLQPTDLTLGPGELITVVGPSGSGKSTLIRLIAGLEAPTTGSVSFGDEVFTDADPTGRRVGLVVSRGALYDNMTAEGNFRFPLELNGTAEPEATEMVERTARRLGVKRILGRKPDQLSGGQRQLVAVGRATVRENDVLLLDEAVTGVDLQRRKMVRRRIRELNDGSRTIIYATNEQDEAMVLGDRMVVIDGGVVQQIGRPMDIYLEPANTFVAQFLGSPGMNILPAQITGPHTVRIGEVEFTAPSTPAASDVLIGIRPDWVEVGGPGAHEDPFLRATVTELESLGAEQMAHVAFGSPASGALDFLVKADRRVKMSTGDRVELALDLDDVSYFDVETGNRLDVR